jgi:hypothetical protein
MRLESMFRRDPSDIGPKKDVVVANESGEQLGDPYRMHLLEPLQDFVFKKRKIGGAEEMAAVEQLKTVVRAGYDILVAGHEGRSDQLVMVGLLQEIYGGKDRDMDLTKKGLRGLNEWRLAFENRHEKRLFNRNNINAMKKFLTFVDCGQGEEYLKFVNGVK